MKRILLITLLLISLIGDTRAQVFSDQIILSEEIFDAKFVSTSDLDNDGDFDVLALGQDKVFVFNNLGNGNFTEANLIFDLDLPKSLSVVDLNLDGSPDLLIGGGWSDDYIVWCPNLGDGTFDTPIKISTDVNGIGQVVAVDLDGDELKDIVATGYHGDELVWYRNIGNSNFSTKQNIASNLDGADNIFVGDFNNDNSTDISITTYNDNEIILFTNNGNGNYNRKTIDQLGPYLNFLTGADIDNDGDLDIISNSSVGKLAWYENEGNGDFTEIAIGNEFNIGSVFCSDLNNDGHIDLTVSFYTLDGKVSTYMNKGDGEFDDILHISNDLEKALSVHVSDLDNDGDMDLLSASEDDRKIAWYRNSIISNLIEQNTNDDSMILPNPVQNTLLLNVGDIIFNKIEILSIDGIVVYSSNNIPSSLDVSSFIGGVYILKLNNDRISETKFFVKS